MSALLTPSTRWPLCLWAALGLSTGALVAYLWNPIPLYPPEIIPKAYTIAHLPGGTGLRMAMVHDVLHERYLRHGPAWDAKRASDALAIMVPLDFSQDKTLAWFAAADDRAVSLERLGDHLAAIALMRRKLAALPADLVTHALDNAAQAARKAAGDPLEKLQRMVQAENVPPMERHVYTTYANLGTFLAHANALGMMAGDAASRAAVEEGLDDIKKSIQLNPAAHFGRETWQALALRQMLIYAQKPGLLGTWDLAGEALDGEAVSIDMQRRAYTYRYRSAATPASLEDRVKMRAYISQIMPATGWLDLMGPDNEGDLVHCPFDEPVLAIIGMWTLGGGPNAHFALTLGHIMESVGERQIAWNAYERAIELKSTYWPDDATQQRMVEICRNRQAAIAEEESPAAVTTWADAMLLRHQKELAWGLRYQQDYQAFEAAQIARGVALGDPHFYDAFFRDRPSIASDPGLSDMMRITHRQALTLGDFVPASLLGMGLFLALGAFLKRGQDRS